jgi:hypothetical protein
LTYTDFVAGEFAKEGIIAQSDAKVKIHATVLNTRYRRVSGEGEFWAGFNFSVTNFIGWKVAHTCLFAMQVNKIVLQLMLDRFLQTLVALTWAKFELRVWTYLNAASSTRMASIIV